MTDPIVYQFQATGADKVISSIKSINSENELMVRFLRELQQAFGLSEKAAQGYAKSLGITGSNLKAYQQAQAEAAKSAGVLATEQSKTTKALQGTDAAAKSLAQQFVASAGARATSFLKETATDALDAARRFNGLNAALLTVSGSQEKAGENFKFIRGEVDRLGLDLEKATSGFNKLVASTKDVELSKEIFTGINEAASALQLSADDTNGVIVALSQIASKGVVSMEELRQQLGERLPGAFGIAAKSVGLTEAEFTKLVASGELKAIPFLKKFAPALKDAFGEGAARNANSLNAQFNRLNTALFELAATVGNAIAPAFKLLADGLISLAAFFKSLPEGVQQSIIVLTGLGVAFVAVAGAIAAFTLAAGVIAPIMATIAASAGGAALAFAGLTPAVAASTVVIGGVPVATTAASVGLGTMALAAGTVLLGFTALVAAVAATRFIFSTLNFEKNLENFEELQRGSQAAGNNIANLGEKTKSQIKVFQDLANSSKAASKEQIASVNAQIAANLDAIESADARIAALQSQLGQEERLDNQIKLAITGEEQQRKALKGKNDELKQTVLSVKVAVDSLGTLSDAYARTNAKIDAASADRQASILERVTDEKEANKQILADDIATNTARLAETEKLIAQRGIQSQALSKSKDPKDLEKRNKIEDEITKLIVTASKQRVDIAKGEATQRKAIEEKLLADLDAANTKALAAIDLSTAFRIESAKRASIGSVAAKQDEQTQIAQIELEASQKRLALITAEQASLKALKGQISGEEFRTRELALAQSQSQAILAIAQNETALLAAEQEKRLAEIQRTAERAKESFGSIKIKLEFESEGLEIQNQLISAQQALQESLNASRTAAFQQELADIVKAGELRSTYNDLDVSAVNERIAISQQLASLGVSTSATALQQLQARQTKENELAAQQRASLIERQALELLIFDIKAKQQQISSQILITEKNIAVAEAQAAAASLAASGADAQQLANAQARVRLSEQALSLAQQGASVVAASTAAARQALTVDQARAQQENNKANQNQRQAQSLEKARLADAAIAKTSKQVADNTQKSAENTERMADAVDSAAKKQEEFATSVANIQSALSNVEVGISGFAGGGSRGVSIKTADATKLLQQQLDLKLRLAKTDDERAAINAEKAKLEQSTAESELQTLNNKISLNEQLLRIEDAFAAARNRRGTPGPGQGNTNIALDQALSLLFEKAKAGEPIAFKYKGGDVSAGQPTVVGEDPSTGAILPSSELFVPRVSGYVMAASKVQALMAKGVPSKSIAPSMQASSPNYLKTISSDIKTLNKKVGQLQPNIEQVNISSNNDSPDDMVYKLLSAQIKARR